MATSTTPDRDGRAASSPSHRSDHRRPHRGWYVLGIIVLVLVVLGLVASPIARAMVNRQLANMDGFIGKTGGVSVALWRGGIDVKDFVLTERGHEHETPLLRIKKASMKLAPSALFHRRLGGSLVVDGVELNIVKREQLDEEDAEKAKQKLKEKKEQIVRWQDALRHAFPMELTQLEVKNAQVHFQDITHQPNAEFALNNLHVVGRDLQNRPEGNGDPLPAKMDVTGVTTGNGKLRINLQLDPIARQPHFAVNFELLGQELPPLNSFLMAYADADVSKGTFEVYSEINAQGGAYDGYVKPLFRDIDFRTPSDKDKSLGKKVKEKVISAVTSVLKNDDNKQVATKAPFAGNFADNQVDVWTTIANLLSNAFVQAIRGGLEGQTPRR